MLFLPTLMRLVNVLTAIAVVWDKAEIQSLANKIIPSTLLKTVPISRLNKMTD